MYDFLPIFKKSQGPETFPHANKVSDRYATDRDTPSNVSSMYVHYCQQARLTKAVTPEIGASVKFVIGMSFSTLDTHKSQFSNTWIIDSDVTSHIRSYSSLFHSYTPLNNKFSTLPNGHQISLLQNIIFYDKSFTSSNKKPR